MSLYLQLHPRSEKNQVLKFEVEHGIRNSESEALQWETHCPRKSLVRAWLTTGGKGKGVSWHTRITQECPTLGHHDMTLCSTNMLGHVSHLGFMKRQVGNAWELRMKGWVASRNVDAQRDLGDCIQRIRDTLDFQISPPLVGTPFSKIVTHFFYQNALHVSNIIITTTFTECFNPS